MRHRIHVKKLSKTPAHRKAMLRNMLVSFFRYEQIKTTRAKGKLLQRYAERMITRARKDTVATRRLVAKWVQDKAILAKLFTTIAPIFSTRNGGYTRIIKIGQRFGDASEMVYISLVEFSEEKDKEEVLSSKKETKETKEKKKSEKLESPKKSEKLESSKKEAKAVDNETKSDEVKKVVSESNSSDSSDSAENSTENSTENTENSTEKKEEVDSST